MCQRRRRTRGMLVASSASISCAAAARLPVLACGAAAQCAVCSRCSSHAWRSVQQLHDRRSVRFGRVALCMARFASRKFRDRRGCGQGGVFCAGEASSSATRHEGVPGSGCSAKTKKKQLIAAAPLRALGFVSLPPSLSRPQSASHATRVVWLAAVQSTLVAPVPNVSSVARRCADARAHYPVLSQSLTRCLVFSDSQLDTH